MNIQLLRDFECLVGEQKILGKQAQGAVFADFSRWLEEFSEYEAKIVDWQRQTLNFLDGETVRRIASESIESNDLEIAFLVIMIWGYSGDARGPARTRRIMEQENFSASLKETIEALDANNIVKAYEALVQNGPKYLSTSFGSKVLYFFAPEESPLLPLIYDRRIFLILEELGLSVSKTAVLSTSQYMDYLKLANDLSCRYSISSSQVEEFLFILSAINSGNYSWNQEVIYESLSPNQREELSALLAHQFSLYLSGPTVIPNGNGGGQYGGYVSSGSLNEIEYELHATTESTVNLVKPDFLKVEWDRILRRGIAQSVRDLITKN